MKIGIDLGGSHIAIGLINEKNEMVLKKEHNWSQEEKEDLMGSIEHISKQIIQEIIENEKEPIEKIGIGYPAARIKDGVVYKNGKIFPLVEILSNAFSIPVYLRNDVKCSALCEKTMGSLKPYSHCFFITLGTGIGGAYFYHNELVVPNGYAGFEVGHTIIEVNGRQCNCGQKGCFEQYASMRVFRKEIENLFQISNLTSDKMFQILESKEKEKEVNEIIERYTYYLSIGLCNIVNLFEPDCICMGGSFAYYAPIFMDKIKKKVQDNFNQREIPNLIIAQYANDAGVIGASLIES